MQEIVKEQKDFIIKACKPYIQKLVKDLKQKNTENATLIYEHILAEQAEYNIKETTKTNKIKTLVYLSRHFDHTKSFWDMTKNDILNHMNALRNNTINNNKWIGTCNYKQNILTKFFRWLYNQN